MTINVFEGARRIAKLASLIGVLVYGGTVAYEFSHHRTQVFYEVTLPGDVALARHQECGSEDILTASRSDVPTKSSGNIDVIFCFRKMAFKDGRRLIPYKLDSDGGVLGNESNAREVIAYVDRTVQSFVVPSAEEEPIANLASWERWRALRKSASENLLPLLGWLAFLWAFTWAIGWIVRGFLGIPRGQDRRPPRT